MAYRLMNTLINNYKKGKTTYTKSRLLEMCDVYYTANRLSDAEYEELTSMLNELE